MSSSSTSRTILVVGATGVQGRSFITSVLGSNNDFRILALTRNPKSASASTLANLSPESEGKLKLVQANLDEPDSVRKVFEDAQKDGGIWGVFVVLTFPGLGADATGEEKQGKLIADLALEYKTEYLVFSSVERGGEDYDEHLTLDRKAKVDIERYIKSLEGLRWTFLRPAFFMENFDGTIGSITATVLRTGLKKDTKLQLIAAKDIGHIAFAVFQSPDKYASQAITVIGDALTTQEINDAYVRGAKKPLPSVPNMFGKLLLATNKHTKALIEDMERVHIARTTPPLESAEALITQCRNLYPEMQTLEVWARERGTKKNREKKDWNNVTIGDLVQGKR